MPVCDAASVSVSRGRLSGSFCGECVRHDLRALRDATLPNQPYRRTRVPVCPQINATRTRASISNLGTHSPPFFEFERVFATRATRVYVPALHGHLRPARSTTSQAMLGAQSAPLATKVCCNPGYKWGVVFGTYVVASGLGLSFFGSGVSVCTREC